MLVPISATAPGAKVVTIYVATNRARAASDSNVFTDSRAQELNYAAFTISIPPTHQPGNIEYPRGSPDPSRDFVVLQQSILDRASFERQVTANPQHRYGIFVHGFNNNFQEALFRLAQMAGDANIEGTPILFDWPSAGKLTDYVADKDSATYSRDDLTGLLIMLASQRGTTEITLFGHSMGAWLTVEAVRQLRLMRRNDVIRHLHVILAAPDIDVDVFISQLAVIGPLDPPMTLLVSSDDRALSFSSRIAGERKRVGAIDVNNPIVQQAALRAGVEVVDISQLKSANGFNHDRYIQYAVLYPRLAAENGGATASQAGTFVFGNMGATLAAPISAMRSVWAAQ